MTTEGTTIHPMPVFDCSAVAAGETAGQTADRRARTLTAWIIDQQGPGLTADGIRQLAGLALDGWSPDDWKHYGTKARVGWPTTAVQARVWMLLGEAAELAR